MVSWPKNSCALGKWLKSYTLVWGSSLCKRTWKWVTKVCQFAYNRPRAIVFKQNEYISPSLSWFFYLMVKASSSYASELANEWHQCSTKVQHGHLGETQLFIWHHWLELLKDIQIENTSVWHYFDILPWILLGWEDDFPKMETALKAKMKSTCGSNRPLIFDAVPIFQNTNKYHGNVHHWKKKTLWAYSHDIICWDKKHQEISSLTIRKDITFGRFF